MRHHVDFSSHTITEILSEIQKFEKDTVSVSFEENTFSGLTFEGVLSCFQALPEKTEEISFKNTDFFFFLLNKYQRDPSITIIYEPGPVYQFVFKRKE